MTRPTDDPNPTDLVAGYILDDLSPEEAARLHQALAEAPTLQADVASLGEAFALLPYDLPMREPSASLKGKILSAASQSIHHAIVDTRAGAPPTNVVTLTAVRQRRWQRWLPAISTSIAAVAIAALGFNQIQFNQQVQQTAALQQQLAATNTELERLRNELQANQAAIARLSQPNTQVFALVGTTVNSANSPLATAQLLAKPGDVTLTLVAQNLPKLPNEQIYRLWAVATPTAAPLYCGQFRPDGGGTAQWVAPNTACTQNPSQLLITLDAPTDPITSAGPLVMQSSS